jgi:hypothetical protein
MFKKVLSFVLACLLLIASGGRPAFAASAEEKQARFVQRVKEGIRKLGTGEKARVEVRLRDKRKLKGYVSEAGEDDFVVVEAKSGAAVRVAYTQVGQVKGHNRSTGVELAVLAGVMALVIVIAYAALNVKS